MQLKDYLDVDKLERYVEEGIVEKRHHGILPLTLYCYSRRATYEDIWDDITTKTRGLIVDAQGTIVARPFEKFFNVETVSRPETWVSNLPIDAKPETFEKLDGSLGIVWQYGSFSGVASKGSFNSEHAFWATGWYQSHCENAQWPEGFTPVAEMICQGVQRHVVSYDIPDQLILLALINNETGEEADYNTVYHYAYLNGMKTAEIFNKTLGDVLNEDRHNKEGYVLSYRRPGQAPLKIKVKHETFLKLQKIVHAATPKSILEALTEGNAELIQTWIDSASPDLSSFVSKWSTTLINAYGRVSLAAKNLVVNARLRDYTKKEAAEFFLLRENKTLAPICFAMWDGKDTKPVIWKLVEKIYQDELTRKTLGDPYDDLDEVERHDGNPDSYHPSRKAA